MWWQGPLLSVPTGEWAEDCTFCSQTVSATMDKIFEKSANMSFTILYISLLNWTFPLSMTREQRTAVFRYWLSSVEVGLFWSTLTNLFSICFDTALTWLLPSCHQNLLGEYPPNHVLSTLEYLASREQKELEEKLTSLDVTQDVTALR